MAASRVAHSFTPSSSTTSTATTAQRHLPPKLGDGRMLEKRLPPQFEIGLMPHEPVPAERDDQQRHRAKPCSMIGQKIKHASPRWWWLRSIPTARDAPGLLHAFDFPLCDS